MEIYRFNKDSPVEHVEFTEEAHHVWVARIFPQPGASPEKLSELTKILNQRRDGIIAVPQSEKGVHTLFASGFDNPNGLLLQLKELGVTAGQSSHEKLSDEAADYTSHIRDASLRLAGVFYLISDASLAVSGLMSGRYKETIAGLLYSSGGLILAKYGHKDSHTHLKDLSVQLGDYFEREGIPIPKDSAIMGANTERRNAIVEGLERFAYRYPSQIFNTLVATCGVQIMQSGISHKKGWDTTAGALVLGGALGGLIIPETAKHHNPADEKKPKKSPGLLGGAYDWVKEKPLRIPGMLWFGNNVAFLFSALKERKKDPSQKSYMFKLGYVATASIANALMFISSKKGLDKYDIDSETMQALMSVAANVIIQYPPEIRDQMINHVAGYMASQGEIHHSSTELAASIKDAVDSLEKNPFLPKERLPDAAPAPVREYAARLQSAAKGADWKSTVTASETAAGTAPTLH